MNYLLQIPTSFYTFDMAEIIALLLLAICLVIQLTFYLSFYRKPLMETKKRVGDSLPHIYSPKVSVVIESCNESDNLSELLPLILNQSYPDFEVIVVNNGSTDESYELLESLKIKHPNLYHTFLPHSQDNKYGFRKLAITLGIKAAKGDIILITEPFCRPLSNRWIASMVEPVHEGKEVVLGHSFYAKGNGFYNRVARFDNLFFSLQYLSAAIKEKPYTGIYDNVAFKKNLFFENKGFAGHLYLENSEDVFVNRIAKAENTAVCLNQEGFMETHLSSFAHWRRIKKSYSVARSCFDSSILKWFSFEAFSRYLFYGVFILLMVYAYWVANWGVMIIACLFFLIRFILQLSLLTKSARYFMLGKFNLSLPLLDLLQPIYNLKFRTRTSRRVH